ncbi:MAG: hypothetical protein KAJ55_06480, partial [Anaerolineales bacterium]|nr:hypothetical protein [Anaerolineales bacterium]
VNDSTVASNTWFWNVTAAAPSAPSISSPLPVSPFSSYAGVSQEFNISISQSATVNWTIDNVLVNTTVGTSSSYTNLTPVVGNYTVKANATNANGTDEVTWTWQVTTAPDNTPPSAVTSLASIAGMSFINWTWTDPIDADFDKVDIFIDGAHTTFVENGTQYYYGTFSSNTTHTIAVYSVDNSSNTNSTNPQNNTNTTLPNTPTGQVTLNLTGITLDFSNIVGGGNTSVETTTGDSSNGTMFNSLGTYYNITSTADLGNNNVTVKFDISALSPSGYERTDIRLYHYSGTWSDITTNNDGTYVYGNVTSFSPFVAGVPPKPGFSSKDPSTSPETIGAASQQFKITVDQATSVVWSISGTPDGATSVSANSETNRTYTPSASGNYTVSVNATNTTTGLSSIESWTWTVRPKTYSTGNRVWDASEEMSNTYTWNPMSFYAFYYDLDGNVGNESLQVALSGKTDRTLEEGTLTYTSTPQPVAFKYGTWGSYNVVGFMAEKYFAGYTAGSNVTGGTVYSTINSKQLHKVISDDDTKRTL